MGIHSPSRFQAICCALILVIFLNAIILGFSAKQEDRNGPAHGYYQYNGEIYYKDTTGWYYFDPYVVRWFGISQVEPAMKEALSSYYILDNKPAGFPTPPDSGKVWFWNAPDEPSAEREPLPADWVQE